MRSLAASSSAYVSQGHSVLVRGACMHTYTSLNGQIYFTFSVRVRPYVHTSA